MSLRTELLARAAGPARRKFTLVEINSLDEFDWIEPRSKYFGLMTAIDLDRLSDTILRRTAELLVNRGLAYLAAWGTDCERWHDAVDRADIDRLTVLGVSPNGDWDPIMTTWHRNELLEDTVWDFLYTGIAAGHYETDCREAVLAATPHYADQAHRAFHLAARQPRRVKYR